MNREYSTKLSKQQSKLLKQLRSRHGRKKNKMCLCEGERSCSEVFANHKELVKFTVCREGFLRLEDIPGLVIVLPPNEFKSVAATVNSQGIMAVVERPEHQDERPPADVCVFVLDKVGDPGNFGTILRTIRAAGLREVWYTCGSVDPFADKVIRAAMAAQFSLKLRCFSDLNAAHKQGIQYGFKNCFLTDPHQGSSIYKTPNLYDKSLIVIGSEAHGVTALSSAQRVTIPMPGKFESLNAAQAATIFIFDYVRRKLSLP